MSIDDIKATVQPAFPADNEGKLKRIGRATVAEVVGAPGVIGGLTGLVEGGVRAIVDKTISAPANISRSARAFAEANFGDPEKAKALMKESADKADASLWRSFLSDAGRKKMDALDNPDIPEAAKGAIATTIDPTTDLNWGLRQAMEWWDYGSETAGIDRSFGNFPLDEELAAIAATSFVGVPRTLVTKAAMAIQQAAGRSAAARFLGRVATSAPVRVAGRVAEITTPFTIPLTPANAFVNLGAGVAITDVVRTVGGEESVINYANEFITGEPLTQENFQSQRDARKQVSRDLLLSGVEEPTTEDMRTTPWQDYLKYGVLVGTGAIIANSLRGYRRPRVQAGPSIHDTGPPLNRNLAQPNVEGERPDQILGAASIARSRTDSSAPLRDSVRIAQGEEMAQQFDAAVAAGSRAGLEQAVDILFAHGRLPDQAKTIPIARLETMFRSLSGNVSGLERYNIKSVQDLAEASMQARNALRDRTIAMQNVDAEIARLTREVAQATSVSRVNRLHQKIAEMKQLRASDVRPSLQAWSRDDLRKIIQASEAPSVRDGIAEFRTAYNKTMDDLLEFRVRTGEVTRAQAREWKATRGDTYVPQQEDIVSAMEAAAGTAAERLWIRGRNKFLPREDIQSRQGFSINRERDLSIDSLKTRVVGPKGPSLNEAANAVNNPISSMEAMKRYASRTVRQTQMNELRKVFVDMMQHSPKTRDSIRKVGTATRQQVASGNLPFKIPGGGKEVPNHVVRVMRDGNVEFYEFADDLIREALEFSPAAMEGLLNLSRRVWQAGTTGRLAPQFAPKALLWDALVGMVTRRPGRSFGLLDGMVQLASKGRVGVPGDPTALLMALYGVGHGVAREMQRQFGEFVANDLAASSSFFAHLAQNVAGGKQALQAIGEGALDRYHRSVIGTLRNEAHYGTGATWMDHHADRALTGWRTTKNPLIRTYGTLLEGIHNGAKMAFFAQNVAVRKMMGKPMSKAELLRLGNETRQLAGDMSKSGLSKTYQRIASTLPYSNVTVQSMSHVYSAMLNRPKTFFFGLFNAVGAPVLYSLYNMQQAGDETRDWWYNKVPDWQRAANIALPIADPERAIEIQGQINDGTYKFDRKDWMLVPMAPEFIPLKQTFEYMLSFFGVGEQRLNSEGPGRDFNEAVKSVVPMIMPPLVNAGAESLGFHIDATELLGDGAILKEKPGLRTGMDPSRVTITSDIGRNTVDTFTALFGTAARIAAETTVSAEHALDAEKGYGEALESMFREGKFQLQRRTAMGSDLWGVSVQYGATPVTDKYFRMARDLGRVFSQFQIEMTGFANNSDGETFIHPFGDQPERIRKDVGNVPADAIRSMVAVSNQIFQQNPVLDQITHDMSENLRMKEQITANRALPPRLRQNLLNQYELKRQETAKLLYDEAIAPWESQMQQMFGQEFTAQEFADLVAKSVD